MLDLYGDRIWVSKKRTHLNEKGYNALRRALMSTDLSGGVTGLNAVADSNHTCSIQSLCEETACPDEELLNSLNRFDCPKENRSFKILSILYATNCQGFDNEVRSLPVRLIPFVLGLVSDQSELSDELQEMEIDKASDEDSDMFSVMSSDISSSCCYDSELDDLSEALDEWVDDKFDDFQKAFIYSNFTGKLARMRMMYQILREHGASLMDADLFREDANNSHSNSEMN